MRAGPEPRPHAPTHFFEVFFAAFLAGAFFAAFLAAFFFAGFCDRAEPATDFRDFEVFGFANTLAAVVATLLLVVLFFERAIMMGLLELRPYTRVFNQLLQIRQVVDETTLRGRRGLRP